MALIVGGTAVDATATEINNALDGMAQGDIVYATALSRVNQSDSR